MRYRLGRAQRRHLWSLLVVEIVAACGDGTPSENEARQALAAVVDSGSVERMHIREFAKTDGQRAEFAGVPLYRLEFSARLDVLTSVLATFGGGLRERVIRSREMTASDTSSSFNWNQWFARGVASGRPLFRGDRILLKGEVLFERKESGWSARSIDFTPRIDSSRRELPTAERARTGQSPSEMASEVPSAEARRVSVAPVPLSMSPSGRGSPTPVDQDAQTPLGAAAEAGDEVRVKELIRDGTDVNSGYGYKHSDTPLLQAAANGHLAVVQALVGAGARVEVVNEGTGLTPLGYASRGGHIDVIRFLLNAGAQLSGGGNYDPVPPLHAAASSGQAEAIRALLRAGADPLELHRGKSASDVARESQQRAVLPILTRTKPQ